MRISGTEVSAWRNKGAAPFAPKGKKDLIASANVQLANGESFTGAIVEVKPPIARKSVRAKLAEMGASVIDVTHVDMDTDRSYSGVLIDESRYPNFVQGEEATPKTLGSAVLGIATEAEKHDNISIV